MSDELVPASTFTLSAEEIAARGGVASAVRAHGADPGRTTRRIAADGSAEVTVWPPFPPPSPAEVDVAARFLAKHAAPAVRGAALLALPAALAGACVGASFTPSSRRTGAAVGTLLSLAAVAALLWRHWPRELATDAIGEIYLDEEGRPVRRVNTPSLQEARAVLAYAPARWASDAWLWPSVGAALGAAAGLVLMPRSRWGAAVFAAGTAVLGGVAGALPEADDLLPH